MSEEAKITELLPLITLQILRDLWFALNALVEFEDEVVFTCLARW